MNKLFFLPLLIISLSATEHPGHYSDDILGRWMSTENNLEVEIFKQGCEYKGRVVWFDDSDEKSRPMNVRCDSKNPDATLRSRKIIGLEALQGLVYNVQHDEWQDGKIYDASSGRVWNAKAWMTKDGNLEVRGFWHFEFVGQNMSFKKV